jgi:transposase
MGRALRGKIVLGTRSGRRSKRVNTIGALWDGIYVAVKSYLHSTTSEFFEQWFKEELLPALIKGCTIIMDNASFHRKNKLREIAAEHGINVLFLPTYSPDLNPIETSWANMKQWLCDNVFPCPCLKEGRISADKFIPLLVDVIPQYFKSLTF